MSFWGVSLRGGCRSLVQNVEKLSVLYFVMSEMYINLQECVEVGIFYTDMPNLTSVRVKLRVLRPFSSGNWSDMSDIRPFWSDMSDIFLLFLTCLICLTCLTCLIWFYHSLMGTI